MPTTVDLAAVEAARERIKSLCVVTPARRSVDLSAEIGTAVWLKLESMQPSRAFKLRGAANAILSLADPQETGVITQSSGNHGRAVAYVAAQLGIPAVICLSRRTPNEKVEAVRRLGAEVIVDGEDQMAAAAVADRIAEERGMVFIPPFDHPDVIAGQGTIGLELIEQCPGLSTIVVPLSGGGLASGVAMAAKSVRPDLRVIGVSQDHGAAMHDSIEAGRVVEVEERPSWADALVGGLPADNTWTLAMCQEWLDAVALVSEDKIADAMIYAFDTEHLVLEGGAAVGISYLLSDPAEKWGSGVAVICTGDNIATSRLLELVAERRARM